MTLFLRSTVLSISQVFFKYSKVKLWPSLLNRNKGNMFDANWIKGMIERLTENPHGCWLLFEGEFGHAQNKNVRNDQFFLTGQSFASRWIEVPCRFQVVLQAVVFFSIDQIHLLFVFAGTIDFYCWKFSFCITLWIKILKWKHKCLQFIYIFDIFWLMEKVLYRIFDFDKIKLKKKKKTKLWVINFTGLVVNI